MGDAARLSSGNLAPRRQSRRPSLFSLILAAVVAGLAFGLFFGEFTAGLRIVGDAYVGLLQMTVLPYIVFALISSVGRLSLDQGKRLAAISISVLALLWLIGCLTVAAMSLALPARKSGAFFSTRLLEPQQAVDFVQLFVPSNPFGSLANNVAPAVVVFCIMFGVALVKVERKEDLLKHFDTVVATLLGVNKFVVSVSPVGIFAIMAAAAGTLSLEEFSRLQAYLLIYALSAVLLTFLVLPMLVSACTPYRYRDILAVSKDALVTVFVIQSLFVVIPMLAEGIRRLAEKYEDEGREVMANPDFIIPIAYPFPHLGKIATLVFIPFAAWFYGTAVPWSDFPVFLTTGLLLSFGKVVTTIPFLLDLQELPADIFKLFLVSGVFAGGISDLMGAMHLMAFTILTVAAMSGLIRFNRRKLFALVAFTVLIGGAMILSARAFLGDVSARTENGPPIVGGMDLMNTAVPATILPESSPNPMPLAPGQSRLDRMQSRGVIRVGYRPDDLPFSFFNARGQLVGVDIEMAHALGRDLGLHIEFVPMVLSDLAEQLAADHFDIGFSGVAATTRRALSLELSESYMELTLALVVPDHLKEEFATLETIREQGEFGLGLPVGTFFAHEIHAAVPQARIVQLESVKQFFEDPPEPADVLLFSAEGGSAWTLIHPDYTVVSPMDPPSKLPIAFPYGGPDPRLGEFLRHWVQLKKADGTLDELYDYWILGRGAESKEPRWSVIRDVLGWVE